MGFFTELTKVGWVGAFGERGGAFGELGSCFPFVFSTGASKSLNSGKSLDGFDGSGAATGDDGKALSAALLATSFERICLYNSAALDVYFASTLPPSVHPCCLKKACARLLPPKAIIFS
uniref:Uncharacterized protein n=1 Tax=Arundo donax TaxID=35708 RepID=A0A0A8YH66_ARUDO